MRKNDRPINSRLVKAFKKVTSIASLFHDVNEVLVHACMRSAIAGTCCDDRMQCLRPLRTFHTAQDLDIASYFLLALRE